MNKKIIPLSLLALPAANAGARAARPALPNVIVIVADDQGYGGVNCYPHTKPVSTPHIDALAASGVRCMQAYTSGNLSSPTRAGLMTGKYQQTFGNYGLAATSVGGVPPEEKMLSEYLRPKGYATAVFGKWHLGDYIRNHPNNRGFDQFFGFIDGMHDYWDPVVGNKWDGMWDGFEMTFDNFDPAIKMDYATYEFTKRSVDFIEKNADRPFFLYVPYNAIHSPLQAPKELVDRIARNPAKPTPDEILWAMTAALDQGVGDIVAALERLHIRDNTIIFYLSDNGGVQHTGDNGPLRGYKGSFYEGGIRVPFIVSYPGVIPAGQVYQEPVISIDIAPTILSLASLPHRQMHGVDLMPYLTGKNKRPPHDVLLWCSSRRVNPNPAIHNFAIRQGRWKLVSDPHQQKEWNLYDLEKDPGEQEGLKERHPEKYKELFAIYLDWAKTLPDDIAENGQARFRGARLLEIYNNKCKEAGLPAPRRTFRLPDHPSYRNGQR